MHTVSDQNDGDDLCVVLRRQQGQCYSELRSSAAQCSLTRSCDCLLCIFLYLPIVINCLRASLYKMVYSVCCDSTIPLYVNNACALHQKEVAVLFWFHSHRYCAQVSVVSQVND